MWGGYTGCKKGGTWEVCSKPAGKSPYGLCDMSGNVMEWTADSYDASYYYGAAARNPENTYNYDFRVLRGGSLLSTNAKDLRASNRGHDRPDYRNFRVGFRCAQ